ncbi:MAG: S-methyl-5-thioribose-1-phosphate isomerase [Deltaproteobacteria bacterium]|nr:S-methyl-5-thioribose-1-phosphate isomerase [Deltaproteobacteria bacterium]
MSFQTLEWMGDRLVLLDQTLLPRQEVYRECLDYRAVVRAISDMIVRGAPAIGVAAAYGVALAAREFSGFSSEAFRRELEGAMAALAATRPTAVNLFWAIERMRAKAQSLAGELPARVAEALVAEAELVCREDVEANRRMGRFGAELLPDPCTVLTHCNAGALATAGYGTALGVVRAAVEAGKRVHVIADETRPFLQGCRLTAWELQRDGVPVTLIADNMAGYRLKLGGVDAVIVGADRIAANGDVANKIGTYSVSVLARENAVPFYVAAPLSTIDFSLVSGEEIPIEERAPAELTHCAGAHLAPEGVGVWNPAFDVTPAANVSAMITELGVARPPYRESLERLRRERLVGGVAR